MGSESVWNEIGWHAEASHLYYSAGWLFESEQDAMLSSLQKLGRGDKLGAGREGKGQVYVREG